VRGSAESCEREMSSAKIQESLSSVERETREEIAHVQCGCSSVGLVTVGRGSDTGSAAVDMQIFSSSCVGSVAIECEKVRESERQERRRE
jgi:hypothetical protein